MSDGAREVTDDVSHVPYRRWCRFCAMERGLQRRHATQIGDLDEDRSRESADYGYLCGVLIAEDTCTGMVFAAGVSMKGGVDLRAARLAK